MNFDDLTGRRFDRLVAKERAGSKYRHTLWLCRCDCGASVVTYAVNLKQGKSRSCGCWRRELSVKRSTKHGLWKNNRVEYAAWKSMCGRCYTPSTKAYRHYGGRGITVCDRWRGAEGFPNFLSDMGSRPQKHSLDRVDVNGNYGPDNCRWTTQSEQNSNRRTCRVLESFSDADILSEYTKRFSFPGTPAREPD